MQATDVYCELKNVGATLLHHAHSVITSGTFLEQDGLASPGLVENRGLNQKLQGSAACSGDRQSIGMR